MLLAIAAEGGFYITKALYMTASRQQQCASEKHVINYAIDQGTESVAKEHKQP